MTFSDSERLLSLSFEEMLCGTFAELPRTVDVEPLINRALQVPLTRDRLAKYISEYRQEKAAAAAAAVATTTLAPAQLTITTPLESSLPTAENNDAGFFFVGTCSSLCLYSLMHV